jgi:hypothetical protein
MAAEQTTIVWSPRSNLDLYRLTTPADVALRMGVPVVLGPDWTWSGSMNPADEADCALDFLVARAATAPADRKWDEQLWRMITTDAARAVGLDGVIGGLDAGMKADIAVFAYSEQPYRAVIEGGPAAVSLVLVNGQALYGLEALAAPLALAPDTCERVAPCGGEARSLCFKGSAPAFTRTVAELEELLSGQLAAVTMPAGYEYAGTLHECERGCEVYAEHQRGTQHALVADEADFQTLMAIDGSDQRNETIGREVLVANAFPGLIEHICRGEVDLLALCKQMTAILAGQGVQQQVLDLCVYMCMCCCAFVNVA